MDLSEVYKCAIFPCQALLTHLTSLNFIHTAVPCFNAPTHSHRSTQLQEQLVTYLYILFTSMYIQTHAHTQSMCIYTCVP